MKLEVFYLTLTIITSKAILNHNPVKPGCPAVVNPKEKLTLDWITGNWFEIQRSVDVV